MEMIMVITGMNLIWFGIAFMSENARAKRSPTKLSFLRKRWRTLVLGCCIFVNLVCWSIIKQVGG
jgi:hypothetical protein